MQSNEQLAQISAQLGALSTQVSFLVERQQQQQELIDEMLPILREVMRHGSGVFADLEKKGYFRFARGLQGVLESIVAHYDERDLAELGAAVTSILDTVRAMTAPAVLSVMAKGAAVVENAEAVEPLGLMGMVRATRHDDVQRGMAVFLEVLRYVGKGAAVALEKNRAADDRKERLAKKLGPSRGRTGAERPSPKIERPAIQMAAAKPSANAASCAVPSDKPRIAATTIDGFAFTADGTLVDAAQWTRELAERIASVDGITLSAAHWRLIEAARADFAERKLSPNIRRLTQIANVSTKDVYTLFPKAPGRTVARLAGLPKPAGCL